MERRRKGLSLNYKFLVMILIVSIIPTLLLSFSSFGTYDSMKEQFFGSIEDVKLISIEESRQAKRDAVSQTRQSLLNMIERNLQNTRDDKIDKYSRILGSLETEAQVMADYIERSWDHLDGSHGSEVFAGTLWSGPDNSAAWATQYQQELNKLEQVGPFLEEIDEENEYLSLAYYSTSNDNLIISKNITSGLPRPFSATERPWYGQASDAGGLVWTGTYIDANTKTLTTTIAAPVEMDGDTQGVVGMDVTLETLQEDILGVDPGFAFLIDSDGEAILYPGMEAPNKTVFAERTFRGTNLLEDDVSPGLRGVAESMVARESGLSEIVIENKSSYVAYGPIDANDWSVGIAVPRDEVTGPASTLEDNVSIQLDDMSRKIGEEINLVRGSVEAQIREETYRYVVIIAMVIVAIIISAFYFSKSITEPIIELQQKAESISRGGIGKEVDINTNDEIEKLADSFNRVIRTIKILQARDAPAGQAGSED